MDLQEIKRTSAEMIVEAVNFATVAGVNAVEFGIELSSSLYLNIRDAMFHFKALCDYLEKNDREQAEKHYHNLKEHLLRGEKDAIIFQARAVCDAVSEIMQQKNFKNTFNFEDVRMLQSYVHSLKNIILKIRLEGAELSDNSKASLEDIWAEVVNYTEKVSRICKEKNETLF